MVVRMTYQVKVTIAWIKTIQNGQRDEQLSNKQLKEQPQSVMEQTLEIAKNDGDDISSIQISMR